MTNHIITILPFLKLKRRETQKTHIENKYQKYYSNTNETGLQPIVLGTHKEKNRKALPCSHLVV
jgi:hypothetical protein